MSFDYIIAQGAYNDIAACAAIACDSEIGRRYGFTQAGICASITKSIAGSGHFVVAKSAVTEKTEEQNAKDAKAASHIAGFAWFEPEGAFAQAPYLKLIAVDSRLQSAGIGSKLLEAFETETAQFGRAWLLLVSDFNDKAAAFYERHGYERAGRLRNFAREGIDEIVMYKLHKANS
ncbi:MAG TPA: N-acetyltransferase [Spirochaetales bacterium]|nr:N-acetyltransferase [Spirochaetales bacterium]